MTAYCCRFFECNLFTQHIHCRWTISNSNSIVREWYDKNKKYERRTKKKKPTQICLQTNELITCLLTPLFVDKITIIIMKHHLIIANEIVVSLLCSWLTFFPVDCARLPTANGTCCHWLGQNVCKRHVNNEKTWTVFIMIFFFIQIYFDFCLLILLLIEQSVCIVCFCTMYTKTI